MTYSTVQLITAVQYYSIHYTIMCVHTLMQSININNITVYDLIKNHTYAYICMYVYTCVHVICTMHTHFPHSMIYILYYHQKYPYKKPELISHISYAYIIYLYI